MCFRKKVTSVKKAQGVKVTLKCFERKRVANYYQEEWPKE